MIEKITDHNLERYDSRLKEWCDRKFFEKGNYGKYETTEESGAVAFYPAPDTLLEGKVKFNFKETMPAEGDKGPSNPSTITGISSININKCGKNLIPYPYLNLSKTENGITFTVNSDGSVTVDGTATANGAQFYISSNSTKVRLLKNKTYFISGVPSSYTQDSINTYLLFERYTIDNKYDTNYWCYPTGLSITPSEDCLAYFQIIVRANRTVNNVTFYPQLEEGSVASEYETPSLTLSTISLGNTYYGGEIDLVTGIMTVKKLAFELDGTENWSSNGDVPLRYNEQTGLGLSYISIKSKVNNLSIQDASSLCSHFRSGRFGLDDVSSGTITTPAQILVTNGTQLRFVFSFNSIAAWKEWLAEQKTAGKPVTVVVTLNELQTVQLSPTQIFSLTQFDKYTPRLNTIYTKANSIQISYLKSPIRDEYEKTQAILSLGGNS